MCDRLILLSESYLNLSRKELSRVLGYQSESTLWKVWHKEAFPDIEKLVLLSDLVTIDNKIPNLHWLITGYGNILISKEENNSNVKKLRNKSKLNLTSILEQLPPNKINHLAKVLEIEN